MKETKAVASVKQGADTCTLTARIATLEVVDSDGDFLLPGSFGEQTVPFLWGHRSDMVPLGKARVFERRDEVLAEVEVLDAATCTWLRHDASTPPAKQQFSWGFTVPEGAAASVELDDGTRVRAISAVSLLEVSGVLRGASVDTATLGVKAGACDCAGGACACSPSNATIIEAALRRVKRNATEPAPAWLEEACDAICKQHGIKRPLLSMFRPASDDAPAGEKFGHRAPEVHINASLTPHEKLLTLGHELMHVYVAGATEAECEAFGVRVAGHYGHLVPEAPAWVQDIIERTAA